MLRASGTEMGQPRSQPKGEAEEERDISVILLLKGE